MPGADVSSEPQLADHLRVIRRRKATVLGVVLLVGICTGVLTVLQTPVYEGKARVLLRPQNRERVFAAERSPATDPVRTVETEIQVLQSEPVRAAVAQRLGTGERFQVSIEPVALADVIEIKARSTEPVHAAAVANAFASVYVSFRQMEAVDSLVAANKQIDTSVAELQRRIDDLTAQLNGNVADPRVVALIEEQSKLKQRSDELKVESALTTGGARVISPAEVPSSPAKPVPLRNGMFALAGGLVLGVGLAFLRERLDDSVRSKADLVLASSELPVLGVIPKLPSRRRPAVGAITIAKDEPTSPSAEAYRSLRTSVQALGLDWRSRVVQITSPMGGEGKTTTVANLGVALARGGQKVILVDGDLRKPTLHTVFGLPNAVGITSLLHGASRLLSALQTVPGEEGRLKVLTSGPVPSSPSELLASVRTKALLRALSSNGAVVLFDSPPLLPVTDASVLAGQVDATVLLVRAETTTKKQTRAAVELLDQMQARLIGTVLNAASSESGEAYAYYGYHYRSAPPESGTPASKPRRSATQGPPMQVTNPPAEPMRAPLDGNGQREPTAPDGAPAPEGAAAALSEVPPSPSPAATTPRRGWFLGRRGAGNH